ncbi:hypothetical protein [Hydrogenophaga intermedia]|uniref:hypothetical protein n=1 Tax=Hydrogenophaga intermedia TaxID=65786 RepID=UPI000A5B39B4|nr:hypothetical protein [Hydrogenophaga intermedia]
MPSTDRPQGVGEVGTPPIAAAVANAVHGHRGGANCPCPSLGTTMKTILLDINGKAVK